MNKKILLTSIILFLSAFSFAEKCETSLKSTDQMTYDKKEITIPKACKEFTIKLSHVGKLPKAAMGHNIVITKKEDAVGVAKDGVKAGPSKNYIKPGDKRVVASSDMIGGGEKTEVKIDVSKITNGYTFFCSFPAHQVKMSGEIKIK